jgi:hypothetical protein
MQGRAGRLLLLLLIKPTYTCKKFFYRLFSLSKSVWTKVIDDF